MEDISKLEKILFDMETEFQTIPKKEYQQNFLEICRYPGNRFEEICSRILQFFLQPKREHKLKNMMLNSIKQATKEYFDFNADEEVTVETEVVTDDNKRIDIMVEGQTFVMSIENKIWAGLYNKLDSYKDLTEKRAEGKTSLLLVLSLRRLKKAEANKCEENGFKILYYEDLIASIKRNVGSYLSECNQKYLILLYDFINTLENMSNTQNFENDKEYKFWIKNEESFKKLEESKNNFDKRVWEFQHTYASNIKEQLNAKTNNDHWGIYGNSMIGIFFVGLHELGIETYFDKSEKGPTDVCFIQVLSWKHSSWDKHASKIKEILPEYSDFEDGDKIGVRCELKGKTDDDVINELDRIYRLILKEYNPTLKYGK